MKKTTKAAFSLILSLLMLMNVVPSFAKSATEEYKLNITFNNLETNQVEIEGLSLSGGKAVVAVTGTDNKALYMKKHTSVTSAVAKAIEITEADNVVYSIDVMADSLPVNLSMGTAKSLSASAGADVHLWRIKDNVILTPEGKKIGSVRQNDFTTITVVVKKLLVCDYYVNGRKIISNWDLSKPMLGGYMAIRQTGGSLCYIDNIRCYKGSKIDKTISNASFSDEIVDIIKQQDFNGDITYFDNRFCRVSETPVYERLGKYPKTHEIHTERLNNHQDPGRNDYIYMKRLDNSNDCFVDINIGMPAFVHSDDFKHTYVKVEGDFKANVLQDIVFMVRDSVTTGKSVDTNFIIRADGSIYGGSQNASDVVRQGAWFHLLWLINLETKSLDVYIDGKKVLSAIPLKDEIAQVNMIRINLNYSAVVGDLYIDNFNITGLINPIVDGVETKTGVIASDDNIIDFMTGKIGMHVHGNTLHKDGIKSELAVPGIFDEVTKEYYVTADNLSKAFDLILTESNGEITGDVTVKADGTVILKEGESFKLSATPKTQNGRLYIPVRQFAEEAVGKYVWWFDTGILLFADYELKIDTTGWTAPAERNEDPKAGCTIWNDIDYLNNYLKYVRPNAETLAADYAVTTGDSGFAQHPRLFISANEFNSMKELFLSDVDQNFSQKIQEFISLADKYLADGAATYDMWSDSVTLNAGKEMGARFTSWGLAYYMTGDEKYVDAAFEQFKTAATFPDFNTANIANAGDAAMSLAIGYDWFYNAFDATERNLASEVVRKNSLDILVSGLYGRLTSTSSASTEWSAFKTQSEDNVIVNMGVILSALATLEQDSTTSFKYISDSIRSVEYAMQMFESSSGTIEDEKTAKTRKYTDALVSNLKMNFGKTYNISEIKGNESAIDFLMEYYKTADNGSVENIEEATK